MNTLSLKPKLNEIYKLNDFILDILKKENLQINLIVEEIFTNIVNYSNAKFIKVNASFKNLTVTLEFIDDGIEFNPLKKENPKAPNTIDDAKIGGLGIFLTKQIADELDYQYLNGKNHLKITKKME